MTHVYQHHAHADHPDDDQWGELLDLDAEVLDDHLADIVATLPVEGAPQRLLDLGCGTGSGTFALLTRFPDAHVIAVDVSADNLRRLRVNAEARGVGERVRTVAADLDADWPDVTEPGGGAPDLVWASASIHHLADPDRALRTIRDLLAPDGLFALVELTDFPRFLPPDAPADRPGLEGRLRQAADRLRSEHLPHLGADWGSQLRDTGFTVIADRTVPAVVPASASAAVGRYAAVALGRTRDMIGNDLPAADRAALDRLLDVDRPDSVVHRDDLTVRTTHRVWAARRSVK
ncbi:SAM-dependent methyltransferase [Tersicoccus phoenicis]|uniref:SAM-dependent methyltransferase n=1 Tax=Tersicoccus phoenicis TaxID=554083 RepID=A0A1R1LER7_9MICC|nr:class I SAM-dependent methyltransferase [Tersicoccus phoenicis]OMH25995.1 SAM-dependent methyltransferase [Tersicoccus phoenicis]